MYGSAATCYAIFFNFFLRQKMINFDFHKGWLRDNKAHLPQWWMDVSSVTGSLSEELSVSQTFKHVEKCARRSYRTLGICFSLSTEQTRLTCLAFLSSFFSLSTAPRPWPFRHSASVFKNLQSSRLWGCLHMNSRGSGFTKRTIFREGRLSRRIIFYQCKHITARASQFYTDLRVETASDVFPFLFVLYVVQTDWFTCAWQAKKRSVHF